MPKSTKNRESLHADRNKHCVTIAEPEEVPNLACNDVQISRMIFKATTPAKEASQLICFPKYLFDKTKPITPENLENGENLIIVTKPIKMVKGGIPKHNPMYHGPDPDSMKRAYFYIPKNEKDPNSMELFNCIQKIDDYMDTEINKNGNEKGILCYISSSGKKIRLKNLTYKRMITTAKPGSDLVDDEGDDDDYNSKKRYKQDKREFVPWDRIKVKLATLYDESIGPDDKRDIITQVYIGNNDVPEKLTTVSGIETKFNWNCVAQFALHLNKVWIRKIEDKACSIGIKCIQIGITELSEYKKSVPITKQLNRSLFASVSSSTVLNRNKVDELADKNADEEETGDAKDGGDSTDEEERSDDASDSEPEPEPEPEPDSESDDDKSRKKPVRKDDKNRDSKNMKKKK